MGACSTDEQSGAAHASSNGVLRDELLERILDNIPGFFEQLIFDLLVAMGYGGSHKNAAAQLGRSGDGGVDGIINEDGIGLDRIYVQAKRYAPANQVGRPDVNGFVGSLVDLGASKGVLVTTPTFSQPARDYLKHLVQRIILIDGRELADLMIEYQGSVRGYRRVKFKRLDEDFFSEERPPLVRSSSLLICVRGELDKIWYSWSPGVRPLQCLEFVRPYFIGAKSMPQPTGR